ncbi:MAG: hypothetical protein ACRDIY_21185, partial [Chloroflexota bacterium]
VMIARQSLDHGIDFGKFLHDRRQSFAQFLDEFPGQFKVVRRVGTDILVGRSAEEFETPENHSPSGVSRSIRNDFYNALIDLRDGIKFGYDPTRDLVIQVLLMAKLPDRDLVPLPKSTLDEQIEWRRQFARERADKPLEAALQDSYPALSTFRSMVRNRHIDRDWHDFKYQRLRRKIIDWASEYHVEVRDGWFSGALSTKPLEPTMADLLSKVADYLTDDELREMKIPLRAFHSFWVHQNQRGNV